MLSSGDVERLRLNGFFGIVSNDRGFKANAAIIIPGLDDFSGCSLRNCFAGVAGALCADPGLGEGLELALDGRTPPSAEFVRSDCELPLKILFGLCDGGTSDPDASDAGFGVIDVGGSDTGTVVPPNNGEDVCG